MADKRDGDDQDGQSGVAESPSTYASASGSRLLKAGSSPDNLANPSGKRKSTGGIERPDNTKTAKRAFLEDTNRPFLIRDGDKTKLEPFVKALIRSVGLHAIKGNIAAQKQYINAIIAAEKSSSSNQDEYDLSNLTEAEAMALRDLLLKAKSKNKQKEN